ncbi:hypothetical protein GX408_10265 [bacterium]|nr:hypothetical protein [bacterium]
MKRVSCSLALFLLVCDPSTSGLSALEPAQAPSPPAWEIGLWGPLRYTWSNNVEISTHPLWFLILPNASLKWSHGTLCGWQILSQHGFFCPTWMLRLIRREGIGGILSPEFEIPFLLGLNHRVYFRKVVCKRLTAAWSLGLGVGLKTAALDERTTIDLPVVYPRMNVFYHGYNWTTSLNLQGPARRRWSWSLDNQALVCPTARAGFAYEMKGLLYWQPTPSFQIRFGYLLSYAEYPFGSQWHLLPLLDLHWRSK